MGQVSQKEKTIIHESMCLCMLRTAQMSILNNLIVM